MKSTMKIIAFLMLSSASLLQASEKQQAEEMAGGMKRAREMRLQDESLGRLTRLNHFLCFPELLPELREKITSEFVYNSLYACKCYEDYRKLLRTLTTSKEFRHYAQKTLREISTISDADNPELRYKYEIFKLVALYTAAFYASGDHVPAQDAFFQNFPRLPNVVQEIIIMKYVHESLYACNRFDDYQKFYSALTTNKKFREVALNTLKEISTKPLVVRYDAWPFSPQILDNDRYDRELRYRYEMLKKFAQFDVASRAGTSGHLFSRTDHEKIIEKATLNHKAFQVGFQASSFSTFEEHFKTFGRQMIINDYITADEYIARGAAFRLFAAAEGHEHYTLLAQLINRCALYYTAHCDKIDVNSEDENGATLLMWACKYGCASAVRELLTIPGVDINKASANGINALIAACRGATLNHSHNAQGFRECVRLLLKQPQIEVNPDRNNFTVLMYAALSGDLELVETILAFPGIDKNAKDNWGWTALMAAIQNGHLNIVQALLQKDGINTDGALLAAARFNRLDIMKILRDVKGIKVNTQMQLQYGRTALLEALHGAESDDCDVRDIELGDCCVRNEWGKGNLEALQFLLSFKDIDVTLADDVNTTPLMEGVKNGDEKFVQEILLKGGGVTVNVPDNEGSTPLIEAVRRGHYEIVRLLLAVPGIDVNLADHDGLTALLWAAGDSLADFSIAQLLLGVDEIDVNLVITDPSSVHYNALMMAVEWEKTAIVKLLLAKADIDIHFVNRNGDNALSIAQEVGNTEIIGLLLTLGATVPEESSESDDSGELAGGNQDFDDHEDEGVDFEDR